MTPTMYEYSCWLKGPEEQALMAIDWAIQYSGHTVLGTVMHKFEPQGYTSLWLLAESHCAVHTYPEHKGSYLQLSSCSLEKYERFLYHLRHCDIVDMGWVKITKPSEHVSDLLTPVEN